HYATLGCGRATPVAQVKKRFFQLALKFHPDRCADVDATAIMMQINAAYACLSDPAAKKQYD
ncbi:DnaJ domain-containing protein, partial [Pelagophyceae sp. CCMP2097]